MAPGVVERRWAGLTVAILAPGPSLTPEDVAYVHDRELPVIAVNDAIRLAPWADVLYSSDREWWSRAHVPGFRGAKFSVGTRRGLAEPVALDPAITVLEHTGETGLELAPTGLRTGMNSGAAAINLAYHTGASRIVLLGYNLGPVAGRQHFFDRGPRPASSPYGSFVTAMAPLALALAERGIRVVNCTRPTALRCFPGADLRAELAEVLTW